MTTRFPPGSMWLVGFAAAGVGGRPIVIFKERHEETDNSWVEHRTLTAGEVITIVGDDYEAEGWLKVLVSNEVGYVWRGRLLGTSRIDESSFPP